MKRVDLIRHLQRFGCDLLRQGGSHTVFVNRQARKPSAVPRHSEIKDPTARKICEISRYPELTQPLNNRGRYLLCGARSTQVRRADLCFRQHLRHRLLHLLSGLPQAEVVQHHRP